VAGPDAALLARIESLAHTRAPTLGSGRLICIDGPAGSGKTTLAAALCERLDSPVVHMDDLYPGWDGLEHVAPEVLGLLAPLAAGGAGGFRRFDWAAGRYGPTVVVEPAPWLVLEGVGAGNPEWSRWCTLLVWVHAPADTRLARGLARDGEALRSRWEKWMRDEQVVLTRGSTRERADVEVET